MCAFCILCLLELTLQNGIKSPLISFVCLTELYILSSFSKLYNTVQCDLRANFVFDL